MFRVQQLIRSSPRSITGFTLQSSINTVVTRIPPSSLTLRTTLNLNHASIQTNMTSNKSYHTRTCQCFQNSPICSTSSTSVALDPTPAATSPADELNHQSARKHNQEYPEPTLLVRVLSTLAIFPVIYFVFDNIVGLSGVRGTSMQPTLNPAAIIGHITNSTNDVALVWKLGKSSYKYERGEVVVLTSPTNPKVKTVKRLIGLEGDWVRDQTNPAIINVVPRGRVWVEGDNMHTSLDDSRQLGAIPLGLLEGKVKYVVWPMARFGPVKKTLDPAGGDDRVARRAIQQQ